MVMLLTGEKNEQPESGWNCGGKQEVKKK